jgi:uncharacterized RDD family membrane protein YckC
MQCPNCKRQYVEQPLRCSCGYDFQTGALYSPPSGAAAPTPLPAGALPSQTPVAPPPPRPAPPHAPLADRWTRLGAVVIDHIIFVLPVITLIDDPEDMAVFMAVVGWLTIIGFQIFLLSTKGQTIGKYVVKIKIVRVSDGRNGGFVTNVLVRYVVNSIICIIPLYGLVDNLFIFRDDRRCVHDHLAGTRVVVA